MLPDNAEKVVGLIDNILSENEIDWNKIERIIEDNPDLINCIWPDYEDEEVSYDSVLSESYLSYCFYENGENLINLTELFMKHGFDPSANDGENGASCLRELCWSSYDGFILEVAKLLLDNGAKVSDYVIEAIHWKLGEWVVGDYEIGNLFSAYDILVNRAKRGLHFSEITDYKAALNKTVSKVEFTDIVNIMGEDENNIIIYFDDMPLVINGHCESWIDPYAKESLKKATELSGEIKGIIGSKLKSLHYSDPGTVILEFNNNCSLTVYANECRLSYAVTKHSDKLYPEEGEIIRECRYSPGRTFGEDVKVYSQHSVLLVSDNCSYYIYPEANTDNDYPFRFVTEQILKCNKYDTDWGKDIFTEKVGVHNCSIDGVYLNDKDDILALELKCDEGFLYILKENHIDLCVFLTKKKVDPSEFGYYLSHPPKGDAKRIDFPVGSI